MKDPFDYFDSHPEAAKKRDKPTATEDVSNKDLQRAKLDEHFRNDSWDDGEYEDIE